MEKTTRQLFSTVFLLGSEESGILRLVLGRFTTILGVGFGATQLELMYADADADGCGIEQNDEACSHKDSVLRTAYCVTGKETRPKGPSVRSTIRSVGLGIHVVRGNYS